MCQGKSKARRVLSWALWRRGGKRSLAARSCRRPSASYRAQQPAPAAPQPHEPRSDGRTTLPPPPPLPVPPRAASRLAPRAPSPRGTAGHPQGRGRRRRRRSAPFLGARACSPRAARRRGREERRAGRPRSGAALSAGKFGSEARPRHLPRGGGTPISGAAPPPLPAARSSRSRPAMGAWLPLCLLGAALAASASGESLPRAGLLPRPRPGSGRSPAEGRCS